MILEVQNAKFLILFKYLSNLLLKVAIESAQHIIPTLLSDYNNLLLKIISPQLPWSPFYLPDFPIHLIKSIHNFDPSIKSHFNLICFK